MPVACLYSATLAWNPTAIENPGNFKQSPSVGAWIGLTTRRYQSG
jgi:transposase